MEYFHREQSGAEAEGGMLSPFPEVSEQLIPEKFAKITDFREDHLFGNVYYDFHNSTGITPYVGIGAGWVRTQMDVTATFISAPADDYDEEIDQGRNPGTIPPHIYDLTGQTDSEEGQSSITDHVLSDNSLGYHVMVGLDYSLTENFSVGAKLRYLGLFEDFKDEGVEWDRFRGNDPKLYDDLDYSFEIDNLGFWGVTLNFKYFVN